MVAQPHLSGEGMVIIESLADDPPRNNTDWVKSSVTTLQYSYPLKILVPSIASSNECHWIYPITFGGGLVGGDAIDMTIDVHPYCGALLTSQESTKIYHCEDNRITTQNLTCTVGDRSLLCVLTDPVVCYKNANFKQTQEFHMDPHGNLVFLDWMIGGRVALQELWQFYSYHNKTSIYVGDKLAYRDNYLMSQQIGVPLATVMEPFQIPVPAHSGFQKLSWGINQNTLEGDIYDLRSQQVMGSCILLGSKLEPACAALKERFGRTKQIGERQDQDLICGISPLSYSINTKDITGIYIRFMASSTTKAYHDVVSHIGETLKPLIGGDPFNNKY